MRIEFTKRAIADLRKIASDSQAFGPRTVAGLEARIHEFIARVAAQPQSAMQLAERRGVYVVPLIRYPYKIFYRAIDGGVRIIHIRHAARRPWLQKR